jgi:DNA-binding response OmpR family regulator
MSRRATSPLYGLRVIVAEDELLISQFIREILLDLGCTVIGPARTLGEALQAIRTNDVDGALLDVQLGEASIHPAVDELIMRGKPFILITGQVNFGGRPARLGDAPMLLKPFKIRQLEDMMRSTFRIQEQSAP